MSNIKNFDAEAMSELTGIPVAQLKYKFGLPLNEEEKKYIEYANHVPTEEEKKASERWNKIYYSLHSARDAWMDSNFDEKSRKHLISGVGPRMMWNKWNRRALELAHASKTLNQFLSVKEYSPSGSQAYEIAIKEIAKFYGL